MEKELIRRNTAINKVIDYYRIKEGGVYQLNFHYRQSKRRVAPDKVKLLLVHYPNT